MSAKEDIKTLILARNDIIYLVTQEEHKAQEMIKEIAMELQFGDYWTWSITDGARRYGVTISRDILDNPASWDACPDFFGNLDFNAIIRWAEGYFVNDAILVLRGFNKGFVDIPTLRRLQDYCLHRDQRMSDPNLPYVPFIIIAPVIDIPKELEKEIAVVDMTLPTATEIRSHIDLINELLCKTSPDRALEEEDVERIIRACQGLSDIDIENALALSMAKTGTLDHNVIKEFKRQIIKKNSQVDIIVPEGTLDNVGGNDVLKQWIKERALNFMDPEAIKFGCKPPKGLLLLGHPGTGKTLAAKCIAASLGLDLVRWDLGRSFQGLVGSSENNVHAVLKMLDAIAPAVVLIDEVDKSLSGTGSSNFSDGGTTNRVYQIILTWLDKVA